MGGMTEFNPSDWYVAGTRVPDLNARARYYSAGLSLSAPYHAWALAGIGRVEEANKNFAGAISAWREAIELTPDFAYGWYLLGQGYMNVEDWPAAEHALEKATSLDPSDAFAWRNLAAVRIDLKDRAGSFAAIAEAVRANPLDPVAHGYYLECLHEEGRNTEALHSCEEWVTRAPKEPSAWKYLGMLRRDTGDAAGAIAAFDQLATLMPRDPEAWMDLGRLHRAAGQHDEALRDYLQNLKLKISDPDAWVYFGIALADLKYYPAAAVAFARAAELDPVDTHIPPILNRAQEAAQEPQPGPDEDFNAFIAGEVYLACALDYSGKSAEAAPHYLRAANACMEHSKMVSDAKTKAYLLDRAETYSRLANTAVAEVSKIAAQAAQAK